MAKVGDKVSLNGVVKAIDGDKYTVELDAAFENQLATPKSGGMPDDPIPQPSIPPGATVIIIYR